MLMLRAPLRHSVSRFKLLIDNFIFFMFCFQNVFSNWIRTLTFISMCAFFKNEYKSSNEAAHRPSRCCCCVRCTKVNNKSLTFAHFIEFIKFSYFFRELSNIPAVWTRSQCISSLLLRIRRIKLNSHSCGT